MIRDTEAQDRLIDPAPAARRRKLLWAGAALVALVLVILLAPWVGRMMSVGASVSAERLSFATVERGPFVRDIVAEGRVVAAVRPTLYATATGTVDLKIKAGETVTENQVLAVVDSPDLVNQLAQQQSELDALKVAWQRARIDADKQKLELRKAVENAEIEASAAARELQRNQSAFAEGAVPQMDVARAEDTVKKAEVALKHAHSDFELNKDSLEFEVKAAKLAVERQQLRVEDFQRQVGELTVRSPVDGQVGQVLVAPRATVAEDAPLLTVIDLSALEVEVSVPESFARDLATGMPAEISGNGKQWPGLISAISPEVVSGEVAARVRFTGEMPDELRQNQRLSVRILMDKRDSALTVARGSFVDQSGGRFAYVVQDGIAVRTPIEVGARSIDKIEILRGLKEGDRIVISGAENFNGAERVAISD